MEIRDLIHGSIAVDPVELPILDSRYFQRLRQIHQLGFAEYSFPSATHNRYIHSLGAMATASRAYQTIFGRVEWHGFGRFRAVLRLGALLHDIGHGPLSHTTEFAMPEVTELFPDSTRRKATHEDYTLKMILDSGLTRLIERAGAGHGFGPWHVASLIDPSITTQDDFFIETLEGERVDFRPILRQLISSELDADRMDYLRRDSVLTGVSYGQFDFDWLVGNLTFHLQKEEASLKCYLTLSHRALYAFEDFLLSRFHMFLMVYFHYKSVIFDEMLGRYFESPDCDYSLPSDIERYCECNDAHLYAHLAKSQNPWAKRIVDKNPYRMLLELHSGIPATKTAAIEQEKLLGEIRTDLDSKKIHYLIATSTSELSKYFQKRSDPLYVRYDNHYSQPSFIPVEQCTDLFSKYSEKRSITRLYVSPEVYPTLRAQGRRTPLRYEDF